MLLFSSLTHEILQNVLFSSSNYSVLYFSFTQEIISLIKKLDRDAPGRSSFRIGVEARDNIGGTYQGKAPRLMEITVTDMNDNKPTFNQPSYNITKQENLGAGQKIDVITATDKDEGNNSKIVYKLEAPATGSSIALSLLTVSFRCFTLAFTVHVLILMSYSERSYIHVDLRDTDRSLV